MLSTLREYFNLHHNPHDICTVIISVLLLQKLRFREQRSNLLKVTQLVMEPECGPGSLIPALMLLSAQKLLNEYGVKVE